MSKHSLTYCPPDWIARPLELSVQTCNVFTHALMDDRPDVMKAILAAVQRVLKEHFG